MSEKEKKELNENELEKAAGGVVFGDHCDRYESKHGWTSVLPCCSECTHFIRRSRKAGYCDLGH